MKNIFLFIFLLAAFASKAQFPVQQSMGSVKTEVYSKGAFGADSGFVFRRNYPDTTTANLGYLKNIPGFLIKVGNDLWLRNTTATAWLKMNGAATPTLTNTYVGVGNGSNVLNGASDLTYNGSVFYANGIINASSHFVGTWYRLGPLNTAGAPNTFDNPAVYYNSDSLKYGFYFPDIDAWRYTDFLASGGGGSQDLQSVATEGNTTTLGLNASSFGVLSSDSLRAVVGYSLDGNLNKYGYLALLPKTDLTSSGSADGVMLYAKPDGKFYSYHDLTGELPLSGGSTDDLLDMDLTGGVDGDELYMEISGGDTTIKARTPTGGTAGTETVQEYTSSTSSVKTLSNTPIAGSVQADINGVIYRSSNVSVVGTTVTLSGITIETTDIVTIRYRY